MCSYVTLVKIIMGRLHVVMGNKQTTQDRPVDRLDSPVKTAGDRCDALANGTSVHKDI